MVIQTTGVRRVPRAPCPAVGLPVHVEIPRRTEQRERERGHAKLRRHAVFAQSKQRFDDDGRDRGRLASPKVSKKQEGVTAPVELCVCLASKSCGMREKYRSA
jgi:hypothetical protein